MRTRRTPLAVTLVAGLVVAACSSGESVITSGNDPDPTAAEEPADEPADDDAGDTSDSGDAGDAGDTGDSGAAGDAGDSGDAGDAGDSGDAGDATDTTEPDPLADLPPCPTEALAAADGVVEITYWHGFNTANEEALTALTDAYNASQDQVRVNIENQGSYDDTIDEYFQSGDSSRPDIVNFPEYTMQQAIDSGTVLPAGACIQSSGLDTSTMQPAVLQAYSASDVLWGMPFNVSVPVLYYRMDHVRAAGLDADDPPGTFAELREWSEALASELGVYGIAVDSDGDSWGGWFIEEWYAAAGEPFTDNDNGRSGRSTDVYFDEQFGVELLTFLQDMIDDELAFYVGDNASGSDHFLKLADPERPASMTIGTSAALGTVVAALSGGLVEGLTPDDIGIAPLPSFTDTKGFFVGGAANYIVAGKDDVTTAAVWDYLTYLVSAEAQSQWSVDTGYMPLRADAIDLEPAKTTFEDDPRYRVAYDSLTASSATAGSGPLMGPHRQVRSELANAIAAVATGADVVASLESAATLAEAYLSDYNLNN